MRKRILVLTTALLLTGIVAGCGSQGASGESAPLVEGTIYNCNELEVFIPQM